MLPLLPGDAHILRRRCGERLTFWYAGGAGNLATHDIYNLNAGKHTSASPLLYALPFCSGTLCAYNGYLLLRPCACSRHFCTLGVGGRYAGGLKSVSALTRGRPARRRPSLYRIALGCVRALALPAWHHAGAAGCRDSLLLSSGCCARRAAQLWRRMGCLQRRAPRTALTAWRL